MSSEYGCLIAIGLSCLIGGIAHRVGLFRANYWLQPISYYRKTAYGLIPFGMSLLMLVLLAPIVNDTFLMIPFHILVGFLFLLSLFMWLFEPRFAKPDWINWVEDNHGDIVPELRRELWRMGAERKEIINDQAKLEEWIAEFRRRR